MPPNKRRDFTDSDRAQLEAFARERSHQDWLKARNAKRWEATRTVLAWIAAVGVAKGILWGPVTDLLEWARSLFK